MDGADVEAARQQLQRLIRAAEADIAEALSNAWATPGRGWVPGRASPASRCRQASAAPPRIEAADQAAGCLPGFASALHRDPRAPVNVTPIAGLERHLHRRQDDVRLALRAVREAVLERNREGRTP